MAFAAIAMMACGSKDSGSPATVGTTGMAGSSAGGSGTGGAAGSGQGGSGAVTTGDETGPCYPNKTCNGSLTCLSGLCVNAGTGGAGGATGGSAGSAVGGKGGVSGVGGGPIVVAGGSGGAGGGPGGSGTGGSGMDTTILGAFPSGACHDCLAKMTGNLMLMTGMVDCGMVVAACGPVDQLCDSDVLCIEEYQAKNPMAKLDCAVDKCLSTGVESNDFFNCAAAFCGKLCELTVGFTTTGCP